jgi:hypothetical protein
MRRGRVQVAINADAWNVRTALSNTGLCSKCGQRPGKYNWGDALALTHGGPARRCGVCVYGPQLTHALNRAAAIPTLTAKFAWAWLRGR